MKMRDLVLTATMLAVSTAPALAAKPKSGEPVMATKPAKAHKEKVGHVKSEKAKKAATAG